MKKVLSIITILFSIVYIVFAEAPELKNMMPNSWQKLTRLSEKEEKIFFQKEEIKSSIKSIDNSFFSKTNIEEKYYQVFMEINSGIQFYRVLISDSPLEEGFNREYKNKTLTKDECIKMQGEKECIWQIVFLKNKKKELQNILVRPYAKYWVSQGKWEGYKFNDLMIKPLNKNEIGFFITEISVAFTADREKMKQNIVPINYHTCKNQIDASNNIDFSKYNIKENIVSAWSKDGIRIQASCCLFDSKCPFKYSIQNAFDGNPATSYVENTEDDLFDLDFQGLKEFKVLGIAIINGYSLNNKLYFENNRMADFQFNSRGKSDFINNLELKDGITSYQIFYNCFPNKPSSISSGINYFFKGSNYSDTCLAEINLIDNKKSFLFGDINE